MMQAIKNMIFQLADMDIMVISDGEVPYDNNCFAPGISREALSQVRGNHAENILLTHNILVFIHNNRIILIDAGNGAGTAPLGGNLICNLQVAGISPDMVTDVVLTHAHPDHIGGLFSIDKQPTFTNATVHIAQAEYDFWLSGQPDFSRSKNSPEALTTVQEDIKQMLVLLKDRLQFFSGNTQLLGFLEPVIAAGHTPGHCIFNIHTRDSQFVHMADICHEELVLFNQPAWGTVFDIDFDLAVQTRIEALHHFADSGTLVFGYHMPWPGFGKVVKKGNKFTWISVLP